MKVVLRVLLLVMSVSVLAHADTVTFKNGDKLSGTFVSVHDGNLAIKSDMLGDVIVPLSNVQTFTVEKPGVILQKDSSVTRGQISLEASGTWVVSVNGASQNVSAAQVSAILPADVYHNIAEVPSKPWQDWKGAATFGFSIQNGDQQTHSLAATVAAIRDRPTELPFARHFRTDYDLTMLFSKAQQGGTSVTSNTISTNLREDYLFTERDFVFGVGQLDHIQPQGLYLRQTVGGGAGRDLIRNARTTLSVLGGLNYVHERFIGGPSDRSIQALAGEKLGMQINKRVRLDQQVDFYPDLRHVHSYRGDASANLGIKIANRITANAGFLDLFAGNPPLGSRGNNIALTTGLGYSF